MGKLESNTKDLKVAKKEFKKLRKVDLIEIIIQLQELILGYKAKIVELERMLEERGYLIEALKECKVSDKPVNETKNVVKQKPEPIINNDEPANLNLLRSKLIKKLCKNK